jgi:hypothetical protein
MLCFVRTRTPLIALPAAGAWLLGTAASDPN